MAEACYSGVWAISRFTILEGKERKDAEGMGNGGGRERRFMTLGEDHLLGLAFLPFQGAAVDQSKEFS